jgi:hypothetical protein
VLHVFTDFVRDVVVQTFLVCHLLLYFGPRELYKVSEQDILSERMKKHICTLSNLSTAEEMVRILS